MGRPPKRPDGRVQTTLRIDPALLARIDAEAERRVIGRNLLITWALERGLDQLPALDENGSYSEGSTGT